MTVYALIQLTSQGDCGGNGSGIERGWAQEAVGQWRPQDLVPVSHLDEVNGCSRGEEEKSLG